MIFISELVRAAVNSIKPSRPSVMWVSIKYTSNKDFKRLGPKQKGKKKRIQIEKKKKLNEIKK